MAGGANELRISPKLFRGPIRRAYCNGMARVFFRRGVLGGMMPLFMHAQVVETDANNTTSASPSSANRPHERGLSPRYRDDVVDKPSIGDDGLFAGTGSAQLVADLAKGIILSNAGESVEAQASKLTWGSLRLLH